MVQESIDKSVADRICRHMNADHMDAVIKYALHYGGVEEFKEVIMTNLTSKSLELKVDQKIIQIPFDHTLKDSEDAHKTLVKMLKSIPK